jgi:hypothetical protein
MRMPDDADNRNASTGGKRHQKWRVGKETAVRRATV